MVPKRCAVDRDEDATLLTASFVHETKRRWGGQRHTEIPVLRQLAFNILRRNDFDPVVEVRSQERKVLRWSHPLNTVYLEVRHAKSIQSQKKEKKKRNKKKER